MCDDCQIQVVSMYKEFELSYNPKPIPIRLYDWEAVHVDYECDSNDNRYFIAGSVDKLKEIIDRYIEEGDTA